MTENRKINAFGLLFSGVFLILLRGYVFGYSERITIEQIILGSDIVVVGTVSDIFADQNFIVVQVAEKLKGDCSNKINVLFGQEKQRPLLEYDFTKEQTAVFCIRKQDDTLRLFPASAAKKSISCLDDPQVSLFKFYITIENKGALQKSVFLREKLQSRKWQERWAALNIINHTQAELDKELELAVLKTLSDEEIKVKIAGIAVSGEKKIRQALPALVETVNSGSSHDARIEAVMAIGKIGDSNAIGSLLNVLNEENQIVREKAAFSLIYFNDDRKITPLIQAANDPAAAVRKAAIGSLENVKTKEVVDVLIEHLTDSDQTVRQEAFRLLQMFTGKSFGYNPFDDLNLRESGEKWRQWWKENRQGF